MSSTEESSLLESSQQVRPTSYSTAVECPQTEVLVSQREEQRQSTAQKVRLASHLSFAANVLLLGVKVYACIASHSMSVLGSAIDSFVDILSQIIISGAAHILSKKDPVNYPAGKARVEQLAVILCAVLMGIASLELLYKSIMVIIEGSGGHLPDIDVSVATLIVLVSCTLTKLALFFLCNTLRNDSPLALALAEDHWNDTLSNAVAITTALVADRTKHLWYMDSVGAILISLVCVVLLFVVISL